MKRTSWLGAVLALAVLVAGMTGWANSAAGSDPEPYIDPNLKYHFDPGPGWPDGWVEPAAPKEVTPEAVKEFKMAQALTGYGEVRPERLELRVLNPLPSWTKEYPYYWSYEMLYCGATGYAYYYPRPDSDLIYHVYNETYSTATGWTGGVDCMFGPVTAISLNRKMTEDEREQRRLGDLIDQDVYLAKGDLAPCYGDLVDGSYENVYVCFNYGDASKKFDVPAYLDVAVGRVRVPIRFVSEMMGAEVQWDQGTQTVTIVFPALTKEIVRPVMKPGYAAIDMWTANTYTLNMGHFTYEMTKVSQRERVIVLQVGSDRAQVDGQSVQIDAPPVVLPPGRTMVPVRFVAEAMGAKVYWVGNDPIFRTTDGSLGGRRQVHIFTPFLAYFEAPDWFLETRAQKF